MKAWTILIVAGFVATGCAGKGVDLARPISVDLPLSYIDLAEIREGSEQHNNIAQKRKFYRNPEFSQYLMSIGYRLASVSDRPHLPYRFFILDDDRIDIFSVGGGFIYISKGLLEFVDSEAELAAVLSHEIAHISMGAHTPSIKNKKTKKQIFMGAIKLGAGAAAGAAGGMVGGPAGSIASGAVSHIGKAMPEVRQHFEESEELMADRKAVLYMVKSGYDPRELYRFINKLSRIDTKNIVPFIYILNSHPPYQERRDQLHQSLRKINFEKRELQIYKDRYASIRLVTMHIGSFHTETPEAIQAIPAIEAPPIT